MFDTQHIQPSIAAIPLAAIASYNLLKWYWGGKDTKMDIEMWTTISLPGNGVAWSFCVVRIWSGANKSHTIKTGRRGAATYKPVQLAGWNRDFGEGRPVQRYPWGLFLKNLTVWRQVGETTGTKMLMNGWLGIWKCENVGVRTFFLDQNSLASMIHRLWNWLSSEKKKSMHNGLLPCTIVTNLGKIQILCGLTNPLPLLFGFSFHVQF